MAQNKKYEKLKTISYLHEQIQNVKKIKNSSVLMERNVVNGNVQILITIPTAISNVILVMKVSSISVKRILVREKALEKTRSWKF